MSEEKWIKIYESKEFIGHTLNIHTLNTHTWLHELLDESNIPYLNKTVEYWEGLQTHLSHPKYRIRLDIYVPSEYETEAKKYVEEYNNTIPEIPDELKERDDADYVEKLRKNPNSLKHFEKYEKELVLNNKNIIKEVVKHNINILKYVDIELANDGNIMYEAVSRNANALLYANEKSLNDEKIIQVAIQQNVKLLELASDRIKGKKSFVKKLIEINKNAYKYISDKLKSDDEILKLIGYDGELIRLYGNSKEKQHNISLVREYWTMGERGWHDNHISNESINDNITLEDFINKYLIYEINGYYKLLIIEDEQIIGTIYLYSRNGNNNYINLNGCLNCKIKDLFKKSQSSKRLECREIDSENLTVQEEEWLKEKQSENSSAYLKWDNIELLSAEDILHQKGRNDLKTGELILEERWYKKIFNNIKRFFNKGQ